MDYQQILDRYRAGDKTNFDQEVNFLMSDPSQGESAALGFARQIDEDLGAQAYEKALAAIETYKMQNTLKVNTSEQVAIELRKAQTAQDRFLKSQESKAIADNVQRQKNVAIDNPVKTTGNPVILNKDRIGDTAQLAKDIALSGGTPGGRRGVDVNPADSPAPAQSNKKTLLIAGVAIVVLIALFYLTRNK